MRIILYHVTSVHQMLQFIAGRVEQKTQHTCAAQVSLGWNGQLQVWHRMFRKGDEGGINLASHFSHQKLRSEYIPKTPPNDTLPLPSCLVMDRIFADSVPWQVGIDPTEIQDCTMRRKDTSDGHV